MTMTHAHSASRSWDSGGGGAPTHWYVATTGSDVAAGTEAAPFLTWQKAIDVALPGDTILVAPGTYSVSGARKYGVLVNHSGTSAAPITLKGHGGRPVLNASGITDATLVDVIKVQADWWRFYGFDVTGATQGNGVNPFAAGLHVYDSSDLVIEQINGYNNQGCGIRIRGNSARNLVLNCDGHHNYDPLTTIVGGNSDGIQICFTPLGNPGNRIIGCRAWENSDDGFDLFNAEDSIEIIGCWAWRNGWEPGTSTARGDGNGFKMGQNLEAVAQHYITRSVAWSNRVKGFDSNATSAPLTITNNTSWDNPTSYRASEALPHVLRNNIALTGVTSLSAEVDAANNSWQVSGGVSAGDFASLTSTGVDGARGADGSLPVLSFLRLSGGSNMIDKGVYIGQPFNGVAPDLGTYEFG